MTGECQTLLLKIGREFFLEKRKYARQSHFNMSLKENIRHFKSRFVISYYVVTSAYLMRNTID